MANSYYFPGTVLMGAGAIDLIPAEIKSLNVKKAIVITDEMLLKVGIAGKVLNVLDKANIDYAVFSDVQPNPTVKNVHDAYAFLQANNCDFVISIGGGSPQDAAKAVGILGANGGSIIDYNGIHMSENKSLPIVAVNTTAGTASEATINYVITDETRKLKMVLVDKNSMASVAVNDANLMVDMPKSLTAATGMDALTHAIEGYLSSGATAFTDMLNLEAVKVIAASLRGAVNNGRNIEAREQMAYGQFVTGMGFSNGGLGIVHSLAHQLGGFYNLPHGICNAILLPHVMDFNKDSVGHKMGNIAVAMGVNISGMTIFEEKEAAINAVRQLSKAVGIPETLDGMGVDKKDIDELAELAMVDPCTGSNPKVASKTDMIKLYNKVF